MMSPWYKFPEQIDKAPPREGVYLLGDSTWSGTKVVYVGRAGNLQERLGEHPDNICLQRRNVDYFAFEETSSSESRERELFEEHDPDCGEN